MPRFQTMKDPNVLYLMLNSQEGPADVECAAWFHKLG